MTKTISAKACKLLMNILESKEPNITHNQLFSTFDYASNDFMKGGFLEKGHDLETYCPENYEEDVNIFWSEELSSFAYVGDIGRYMPVETEQLRTYDIKISGVINLLRTKLDILPSTKYSSHLDSFLHYIGNCLIEKRRVAIFFARQVSHHDILNQIEEFFIKSPTNLPKLILTSSRPPVPKSLIDLFQN